MNICIFWRLWYELVVIEKVRIGFYDKKVVLINFYLIFYLEILLIKLIYWFIFCKKFCYLLVGVFDLCLFLCIFFLFWGINILFEEINELYMEWIIIIFGVLVGRRKFKVKFILFYCCWIVGIGEIEWRCCYIEIEGGFNI